MFILDKNTQKRLKRKRITYSNERVKVISIDELYGFIEKKNKIYVITLVSRDKRQIVEYGILFDRSVSTIQRLVDNSPKTSKYYSDAYFVY